MRALPEVDEHGRPETPYVADEVGTLLGFLDHQRATVEWKCHGLTDGELRRRLPPFDASPSAMSLGGLLKHLARVEDFWFSEVVAQGGPQEPWASMRWAAEWSTADDDSGDELRTLWAGRVARSRAVVDAELTTGAEPLSRTYAAWGGRGRVSLRWVLVHMIEEYARHAGHADLLREAIDGQTGE